jgi:hypothetical protein
MISDEQSEFNMKYAVFFSFVPRLCLLPSYYRYNVVSKQSHQLMYYQYKVSAKNSFSRKLFYFGIFNKEGLHHSKS